jgi:hypothetical protein
MEVLVTQNRQVKQFTSSSTTSLKSMVTQRCAQAWFSVSGRPQSVDKHMAGRFQGHGWMGAGRVLDTDGRMMPCVGNSER